MSCLAGYQDSCFKSAASLCTVRTGGRTKQGSCQCSLSRILNRASVIHKPGNYIPWPLVIVMYVQSPLSTSSPETSLGKPCLASASLARASLVQTHELARLEIVRRSHFLIDFPKFRSRKKHRARSRKVAQCRARSRKVAQGRARSRKVVRARSRKAAQGRARSRKVAAQGRKQK